MVLPYGEVSPEENWTGRIFQFYTVDRETSLPAKSILLRISDAGIMTFAGDDAIIENYKYMLGKAEFSDSRIFDPTNKNHLDELERVFSGDYLWVVEEVS